MKWPLKSLIGSIVLAIGSPLLAQHGMGHPDEWKPIFDGETLAGWDGHPEFWSVEDGAITGQTSEEHVTKGNTFLIWRGGEPANFELKAQFRIGAHNSGIQYRSFETDERWVVGGYQADIDFGNQWSGTNYGERFGGILARRGEKATRSPEGERTVTSLGDAAKLAEAIKVGEWNTYHIVARGHHLVHEINGTVMSEFIDHGSAARSKGVLALQLHAGPPMKVQFKDLQLKTLPDSPDATRKVVFVAGGRSHGNGAHEHRAGSMLLAKRIAELPGFEAVVVTEGWPEDESVFDGAAAVVIFCDGGEAHPLNPRLEAFDEMMKRGVGLGTIHYAVETVKGPAGDKFLEWQGGFFEPYWSINPHWRAKFEAFVEHPVTRGLTPFEVQDEWYYHMRFREGMEGVTPILTAMPDTGTLMRPDGPHSNNEYVRDAVVKRKEPQHLAWAATRDGGGRGFGFTGGHNHINWQNDNFRRAVLNGIVWISHGEVPEGGVPSGTPDAEEMDANQDMHGDLGGQRVFPFAPRAPRTEK
ncbi:Trehalose utilization [Planctomycetes bacterium Poly30]|uniref:Trehalose utilization n=1 Tax=Saltatorellus ferox TaxID=2528018 RepID=A0A518ES77_9BACT|nr:Trehalose utilization [Planctomycetes bacterium Poly30]